MVTGRGGMGSHKHGTSGHSGPSPRFKQNRTRETNQKLVEQEELRKKKANPVYSSVTEAFKHEKPK